jgi:hypothetical protein
MASPTHDRIIRHSLPAHRRLRSTDSNGPLHPGASRVGAYAIFVILATYPVASLSQCEHNHALANNTACKLRD